MEKLFLKKQTTITFTAMFPEKHIYFFDLTMTFIQELVGNRTPPYLCISAASITIQNNNE